MIQIGKEVRDFSTDFRFWVEIMQEHALFIKMGAPNDRPDIIAEAQRFYELFTHLLQRVVKGPLSRSLILEVREATLSLLAFKRRLLAQTVQCQVVGGTNFALFLDHVAREAVEFLHFIDCCLQASGTKDYMWVLHQEVFWLKVMADHAKFIRHLLDPSERLFTEKVMGFSDLFDQLFLQAWELRSMTQAVPETFPTVGRFTAQVVDKTRQLRDFKATARELIAACRVLGQIPEDLAEHVTREAQYFLGLLTVPGCRF